MLRALLALFIGCLLGLSGLAGYIYIKVSEAKVLPAEGITLRIENGWGGAHIAKELETAKVIDKSLYFRISAKLSRSENNFRAGKYRFKGKLTVADVVKILREGQVLTTRFVIPEGLNQWQIAEKLVEFFPAFTKDKFLESFSDPAVLKLLPPQAKSAEGYLFPETYEVSEDATPKDITLAMVTYLFNKVLTPELQLLGKDVGLDTHKLVTLASIIEKETGDPTERGMISAVFHNRLRKHMKLQTDPTVIYGIWDRYDGNIRKKDLLTPTPYNTYTIDGLPPGPIASPGADALTKAATPDSSQALYFVAKGDGSGQHEFSNSLEEHNRAVGRYLRRLRQNIAR
jgi:UPF0755 protein